MNLAATATSSPAPAVGAGAPLAATGDHQLPAQAHAGRPPLDEYYNSLFTAFGPQHWWPGKTPFEVIVGAILTQNTSWTNVDRAIANLRSAGLLRPSAIEQFASAVCSA